MSITFISYFDTNQSRAKKRTESTDNDISYLANWPACPTAPTECYERFMWKCVIERQRKAAKCVSQYICTFVCVRMENDQFKQKVCTEEETRPNLGSVTD